LKYQLSSRRFTPASSSEDVFHASQASTSISKATDNNLEPTNSKAKTSFIFHNLSQPTRTLIKLHNYFLQALSIHYAHTNPNAPAELGRLLQTITRLWKERAVTQDHLQKMLAVYEIGVIAMPSPGVEIVQSRSPFKLTSAGSCKSVEYTGQRKEADGRMSISFIAGDLHNFYKTHIYTLESAWKNDRHVHLSFFQDETLDNYPKLACSIGPQTAARKAQSSRNLAAILRLSNATQLRNEKSSSSPQNAITEAGSTKLAEVANRKQNLLDRIQVKQLASKTKEKPTALQILREHALGKISHVTDVLRMMQQHHQKTEFKTKNHNDTSSDLLIPAQRSAKVSFSFAQIRDNTRSSTTVPISDEEVKMCLTILSEELEGTWVKMIERGGLSKAVFVVLEGEGLAGSEVKRRLGVKRLE
jgi:DNA replication factor Cdt1 C-terminal domain